MTADPARFARLTYDGFRALAAEEGLSPHERIGFPDSYRQGYDDAILSDIRAKVPGLDGRSATVVDLGCGCGTLVARIAAFCREREHRLVLVDSAEVLARVPAGPGFRRVTGRFPEESREPLSDLVGKVDVVLAYSVLHYVVIDGNPFGFVDRALELLAPGGHLLVGDIPNQSMRRRFFRSESGRAFHRAFTGGNTEPEVVFNALEPGKIDDAVMVGLVSRARAAGFDAWIVPQAQALPMANRREDLLFRRP
jgi:SAM-dependent methyltransferase